jgi:Transglutaminase-like superfamily
VIAALVRKSRAALDVGVAALAVARARRRIAHRPVGALVGTSDVAEAEGRARALEPSALRRGLRWGAAVDRALRWLPGDAACLVRASALHELLVAHGSPAAVVRIGVRRDVKGFAAHAWVELDGTPIAESSSLLGAFASLDGVTLQ